VETLSALWSALETTGAALAFCVSHWRGCLAMAAALGIMVGCTISAARRHPITAAVIAAGFIALGLSGTGPTMPTDQPDPTEIANPAQTEGRGWMERGLARVNRGLDWAIERVEGDR